MDAIFYPCMPYNFNEGVSDNNYNCPVVAYYPELLAANVPGFKSGSGTCTLTSACTVPGFRAEGR